MKIKLLLLIVFLFMFPPLLNAFVYLDKSIADSPDDLHLHVYYYNSQDNKWERIWSETLKPRDYKGGELPCYDLSAFEGGILIANQGQAVYFQNIVKPAGDMNIRFAGDPISFHALDWAGSRVKDVKIDVAVFIPEMSDYIDLYQTNPVDYAEVRIGMVNPSYQYRATIKGDDIYEKEIFFSSDEDFKEEVMLDEEGEIIFDNPVYLIRKNSIYGSTWYEKSGNKCMGASLTGLFYYDSEGELIMVEPHKPCIHNRFLFIIDEEYASEKLCIAGRNPLTKDQALFDVFISREPYELFFDEEMLIIGKVSNEYLSFPLQVKAYMHYSYMHIARNQLIGAGSVSDSIGEIYTDHTGNFHIPVAYFGDIISRYHYSDPESISDEELYLDLFLYCELDGIPAKLVYRQYFDEKMIERYSKAPMILELGDVFFREGIDITGCIRDKDNNPVPGANVYLGVRCDYGLFSACLIDPEKYSDSYSEYLRNLSRLPRGSAVTDDKGFFRVKREAGICPGDYDLYIYHDRYTLTYYPNISIKKDTDLGDLEINHGNKIRINLMTDSDKENIEVKIKFKGFDAPLDLISDQNGILTYYKDRLLSYKYYKVFIYRAGVLLEEIMVSFEPDERNIEKTIDIIL